MDQKQRHKLYLEVKQKRQKQIILKHFLISNLNLGPFVLSCEQSYYIDVDYIYIDSINHQYHLFEKDGEYTVRCEVTWKASNLEELQLIIDKLIRLENIS